MGRLKNFTDKVWYGMGAVGLDLSYGMFNGKLSKYMTDVLGLNTNFLLGLTAAARIWDGINDPMMGSIVDGTSTRFGRYRPWVAAGACLNAVVLFFLFFNPGFGTQPPGTGLYVYMGIMYVLWGMTNTAADIPYWSMVPSFTADPKERNILATVARTFSGIGQGIILIGSPLILNALGTKTGGVTVWTQRGYTLLAAACGICLVFLSFLSMSRVRETVHVKPQEKFSFGRIFGVIKSNDQLRVFMLFAMLSNAGFYTTTGVQDYFFAAVMENTSAQSLFNAFGAVGSILGLGVIPLMTRFTSKRNTYRFSLLTALAGYAGMFTAGQIFSNALLLDVFFLVTQTGTASMFVAQTVFLADIVDYGEVATGVRAESVTFSMKGFLQKMAYTFQTIILYISLGAAGYNRIKPDTAGVMHYTRAVRNAVSAVMYVIPPIFFILSLAVFTAKFRLHGEYMEEITKKAQEARLEREKEAKELHSEYDKG